MISQIVFAIVLATAVYFFVKRIKFIRRNVLLGKDTKPIKNKSLAWKNMFRVALGQSKMTTKPLAAFFHIIIYAGFILINIEVAEIIIDGLLGTHRALSFMGNIYSIAIGFFEILAVLVAIACVVFLARRFLYKVKRLNMPELRGFPQKDAALILLTEIILMSALLLMNASDLQLQWREAAHYSNVGNFPISSHFASWFSGFNTQSIMLFERTFWWLHIIGILLFLNYVPFSKHLHIILSFPNTFYTPQKPIGQFTNMESVTTEVKLAMDFNAAPPEGYEPPTGFGAKDVQDLTWKNLLDAYSCTECGRCTSVCPANITGKLLSPRKIMMDTRDRMEEVGKLLDAKQAINSDEKNLHHYISKEELWACTSCNACVQACPVNINPLDIIIQMRQHLVLEQSAAPTELNGMFSNLENNGAPWQFSASERGNWAN